MAAKRFFMVGMGRCIAPATGPRETMELVLPRVRLRDDAGAPLLDATGAERLGNLYSNLLDYVVFSVLVFYVLTIAGLFVLRRRRPDAERPYRALGYPVVPALYMVAATAILGVLVFYRPETTWPGLLLVMTGFPVYYLWHGRGAARPSGAGSRP